MIDVAFILLSISKFKNYSGNYIILIYNNKYLSYRQKKHLSNIIFQILQFLPLLIRIFAN